MIERGDRIKGKSGPCSRQRGMTFIGLVIVLVLAGFFVLIGLRVIPVYLNEYKIASSFKEIQQDHELQSAPPHVLQDRLQRRLDINEVDNVKARNVKIHDVGDNARVMALTYQVSKPLFGNIHLVFTFQPKARLEGR